MEKGPEVGKDIFRGIENRPYVGTKIFRTL